MPTATPLLTLLNGWSPPTVVVVGDFMLDRYLFGNADRLAPDAPVPVLDVQRTDDRPGGASNVCVCLAALRARVRAVGIAGDDEPGRALRAALQTAGVETAGLAADGDRPTTVKQNLVGLAQHRHPQKMFRLDFEDRTPLPGAAVERMLAAVDEAIDGAQAVILEDYHKGVCTPELCRGVIERAHAAGLPVLVDPAAIADYGRYAGADAITPNRTEAERATGLSADDPSAMAARLQAEHGFGHVVLTLDRHGALLRSPDGVEETLPTRARSVYDVTGAGDVVLATLAAAVAQGAAYADGVRLANLAAGLEVERSGVVPIPLEELYLEAMEEAAADRGKVRTLQELVPELAAHRHRGRTVAFTNGCFDVLHAGHVGYLRSAAATADLLVVGVNDDQSIRRLKGPERPVNPLEDRLRVLSELACVRYVVPFATDTPLSLIEAVQPSVLVKGADYTRDTVVGASFVEARGGRVELVPLVEGRSTTNILRRIGGG
ncbi:D-glycero-beta-D-manno-heptose 1-phosphate adenylyltransferase [Phycisphaera mikurensis]|uniref:Bifunctional protein HldE n=1 Tax=Phycisphaera mikurensis (strain NBRC 102666 / KCTC 22515 / FYK2301M01) TaxID=1142394 RepID=I0IAV2_PHYMF|nr:D-glycero-beta-D-manno-heptose 1-phosphate adenylyltransferase [Phycisphaera mikurensis]MBB6442636.1 D-beta-D-heptose 7-phosphate kinase/D-beta-D-heptose 1-phosphate adenosyltransferase [Phycisphaera mikurensis]BAM02390.1 D-beta-D-heptose 7-phosphate kinase/D-beta-D-heptose 1-phosphate adenosyltransferase [Phycisphaera mikurensis NBRC 102666]